MRLAALLASLAASALLSLLGFKVGSLVLGYAALAGGAAWLFILWKGANRVETSLLLAIATAIATIAVLCGASIYLAGIGVVLSIASWDLALATGSIAPFPEKMRRHFVLRHVIHVAAIATVSYALLVIPMQVQITIGFNTALGLGLGVLLLLALLLYSLGRHGKRYGAGDND